MASKFYATYHVHEVECPLLAICDYIIRTMKDGMHLGIFNLEITNNPPITLNIVHNDTIVTSMPSFLLEMTEIETQIVIVNNLYKQKGIAPRRICGIQPNGTYRYTEPPLSLKFAIDFNEPDSIDKFYDFICEFVIFYMAELAANSNQINRPHYAKLWADAISEYESINETVGELCNKIATTLSHY